MPFQEVIWASYFGRRYLGEVRSVAMPLSLVIGAGAPLAVASYFDRVGNYDGAFYAISALWAIAAALVMLVRHPRKRAPAPTTAPDPLPYVSDSDSEQAVALPPRPPRPAASLPHRAARDYMREPPGS